MILADLFHEWDTELHRPATGLATFRREFSAGHQPRERPVACARCRWADVWSFHAVCDACGPATCERCEVAT